MKRYNLHYLCNIKKKSTFNENHLRPCPVLDNPEKIQHMVDETGAYSTQPIDREDVRDLTAKTEEPAKNWAPTADKLWDEHLEKKGARPFKATDR